METGSDFGDETLTDGDYILNDIVTDSEEELDDYNNTPGPPGLLDSRDENFVPVHTDFTRPQPGPKNIPDTISEQSTGLEFLNLFLGDDVYARLCLFTNLHADCLREENPNSYYAGLLQHKPVEVDEMKAFIALRVLMEFNCNKHCYEGWTGSQLIFCPHTIILMVSRL